VHGRGGLLHIGGWVLGSWWISTYVGGCMGGGGLVHIIGGCMGGVD